MKPPFPFFSKRHQNAAGPGFAWLLVTAWFCVCGFPNARAETTIDPDFNSRLWQMEDGLPHNIVQALAQTRDGYLWVGTREGLARFDGLRFQPVALLAGSRPPSVISLCEGADGNLWIGTENLGLFRFRQGRVARQPAPDGALDFSVHEIHEAGDGSIWIASSVGLLRLAGGKLVRQGEFKGVVQSLCVDRKGTVWMAGNGFRQAEATTNELPRTGSLPREIRKVYCDPAGVFWMGAGQSLVRWDSGEVTDFPKAEGPSGFVSTILRDKAGELWIGSYSGISRFANGKFINQGMPDEPSYRVYSIFEDHEGNIWVGSEEGLARLTPKRFRTITKKDGLTLNTVVTVCASRDGSVWISAWGGGLNHWQDGSITVLNKSNGLSSDFVMAMTEGRDGSLWAGTDYGSTLNRIRNGGITCLGREQGFVASVTTALLEDDRGLLWIGSRDSLQSWDGTQFKRFTTKDGLSNNKINALCRGAGGVVWVGTDNGLTRWHDGRFENLSADNPALQLQILSLYEDKDKTLWIGTKGHGLVRWQDGATITLSSSQGLFSDTLYSILEDSHGNLWLNSSRGIFRFNKVAAEAVAQGQKATVASISYGKADGILSSGQYREVTQPAACKSTDGRLWFRTTQGVAVVDPKEITTNELPPPVVIQEIVADKQLVPPTESSAGDEVAIRPGRGELEIQYAALSFRAPEKNQYRYKLEGVDPDWVDAGTRRVALYNNLRPGRYRFQVTACNNDGVWSAAGVSTLLRLEPHFWQTWWFTCLGAMTFIGLVGGTARYATRRRMQRKLARLEQQNAIERERARIARDMHDELGARLTYISFQGATAARNLTNPPAARTQIEKMARTARELVSSLDEIVWAVDPGNDSLENLASYVYRFASEFFENTPVRCQFSLPTKLPAIRITTDVRHNLFLAVKEVLNNTLKHAQATRIELAISATDEQLAIVMADDGQGMPAATPPETDALRRTGHGLTNIQERLTGIGGSVQIETSPGRGTKVWLRVPLHPTGKLVMRT